MEYGLIGEKLTHSFSKEIHTLLAGYDYRLFEISKGDLSDFFKERNFKGINVTIPYKSEVIKYLDCISDEAKSIGAVNTVVNKGGKLYGYNTDVYGLSSLLNKNGIDIKGKKVAILGSGGTSKTALFVAESKGAGEIIRVSRTQKSGFITYDELNLYYTDTQVIINTTPVGMFPNTDNIPIDIKPFKNLEAVADVIYNPLKSRLLLSAEERGIKTAGGLYMLVMQACKSAELFLGEDIDYKKAETVYDGILKDKQNIVLIGMPSAGKTTVGKILSESLGMPFFDSDEQIFLRYGRTPADIIKEDGEPTFRKIESEIINELSIRNRSIIATGGGAVINKDNILALKGNGRIYYIDRPINLLTATDDRPLSSTKSDIMNLYNKRKKLYENAMDVRVLNDKDTAFAEKTIREDFLK